MRGPTEELEPTSEMVMRERLGNLLTSLIFSAQDVGFELAMLECGQRENCPLVEKTRGLIREVRELFEFQRKIPGGLPRVREREEGE